MPWLACFDARVASPCNQDTVSSLGEPALGGPLLWALRCRLFQLANSSMTQEGELPVADHIRVRVPRSTGTRHRGWSFGGSNHVAPPPADLPNLVPSAAVTAGTR